MSLRLKARAWACTGCGIGDEALRYPSGKITRCLDCQKFYNLRVNAERSKRTRTRPPKLLISQAEFLDWVRGSERRCMYCGLAEADVPATGMKTQIGLDLHALGIDRIDSAKDYSLDNIGLCCFACNKAKGNVFSQEEMMLVGEAISKVWARRFSGRGNRVSRRARAAAG